MHAVSVRADSGRQQARLRFTLTPRSGAAQVREAKAYRMVDDTSRRLAIAFESPPAIRGSSFLTWDARNPAMSDDQWLYLPALRRTRRIPGRERGSYFLGTDLTYDDIRSFGRVEISEFRFSAPRAAAGHEGLIDIQGEPSTAELRQELGYGRVSWRIDPQRDLVVRSTHWDEQNALLKTIDYSDLQMADGIWFARTVAVENHKTGHRTWLQFSDVSNRGDFDPALLSPAGLERGG